MYTYLILFKSKVNKANPMKGTSTLPTFLPESWRPVRASRNRQKKILPQEPAETRVSMDGFPPLDGARMFVRRRVPCASNGQGTRVVSRNLPSLFSNRDGFFYTSLLCGSTPFYFSIFKGDVSHGKSIL